MKHLNIFESWNDNNIDKSLFISGRAKYHPKVGHRKITYHTGTTPPYYTAEILQSGSNFICDIYKHRSDGSELRVRHKIKETLKTAHNYIREFLNDRLKKRKSDIKDDKKGNLQAEIDVKSTNKNPIRINKIEHDNVENTMPEYIPIPPPPIQPRNNAIIRNFD